ncbi:uncharacterized protein LOC107813659 isoform X2 [Nicotiana tabacum]|nr:PREDICTED: uncharacterized protein LOC104232423 isoform X2 [Nicotiana sylvestris]XP_009783933.1 PREDICTED: uncharacterized protein LOC104232423 isoform X2 [Nicotiana sylvestris]
MILNYASSAFVQWNKTPKKMVYFSASAANLNTEKLREQLDHLHKEAQTTRNKANSARSRLLRLSEAAEKFRRQAAVSIQTGKENDARELLFQKKKIMQAMEKSKSRIELLDELAAKLNEAISMREKQLIGNVAFDLDIAIDDAPSPVRIVSPKDENPDNSDENEDFDQETIKLDDSQELQAPNDNNAERITDYELKNLEVSTSGNMSKEADKIDSLKGVSSYEEFLEHIDQQLRDIEVELITFLRFSSLILESKEKLENSKVQQALDVLEGVHQLRGR